jgi:hypothetical protein
MPARRWYAALLVLVSVAVPVYAQAVNLEWKFEKGKKFYQKITTTTKQDMTISNQKITQTQTQTFYFSWEPKEYDKKAKTWTVTQKIEGVELSIEIGGQKIVYDSTKDAGQANPLSDFFKQLVDSEFTMTIGDDMKIKGKIEGKDTFINKLIKNNQQMEPLLKEILNDEAFKQMADPTFASLPGKPVKKGDKWTRESDLNMGPIGKYHITNTYTYQGEKDKKHRITVESKLTYTAPDNKAGQGNLPFKIEPDSTKLDSKKSSGEILFDLKTGRVTKSTMNMDIEGTLNINIGGMTTKVELKQSQKTEVETSDKSFIKKK